MIRDKGDVLYTTLFSSVSYTGREERKQRWGECAVKETQHVILANRANISVRPVSVPSLRPFSAPDNPSRARNSRCHENLPLHPNPARPFTLPALAIPL
jgi:hypothetical protein